MTDQERRTQRWLDGGLSGGVAKTSLPEPLRQEALSSARAEWFVGRMKGIAPILLAVAMPVLEPTGNCEISRRSGGPLSIASPTTGWKIIEPSGETAGWAIARSGRVHAVIADEGYPRSIGAIVHPLADPESRIFPGGTKQSELALHGDWKKILAQGALLNGTEFSEADFATVPYSSVVLPR